MPPDQFFGDGIERIVNAEFSYFGGHLSKEDGLQHQVSEFFGQPRPVALIDGVENFVGFFQQIWLDGVESLFAIPGAAAGRAQPGHDSDQALKPFPSCRWILWHSGGGGNHSLAKAKTGSSWSRLS